MTSTTPPEPDHGPDHAPGTEPGTEPRHEHSHAHEQSHTDEHASASAGETARTGLLQQSCAPASESLKAPCAPRVLKQPEPAARTGTRATPPPEPKPEPGGHGHGHGHDLPKGPGAQRRLAIVLGITVSVLVLEAVGAALTGSLALLADAGHMLTDAAGLTLSLVVAILANRPPTVRLTWGWKRAEILSAAIQATALLAIGIYILVEGVQRLIDPPEVASTGMLVFGAIGLLANAVSILILLKGAGENMNTRAAFLEVVNDALGSVAVLVAAAAIWLTGWTRADAVASILIGTLILPAAGCSSARP